MFFKKKKETKQNLQDKIYGLQNKIRSLRCDYLYVMDENILLLKRIEDLNRWLDKEKCTKNREYIVLLVTNCRYSPKSFKKNRIKNNLEGDNEKFYLYQLGDSGYYTWILDIKYWDLFDVEIGSYTGRTKKLDNVSELISTEL